MSDWIGEVVNQKKSQFGGSHYPCRSMLTGQSLNEQNDNSQYNSPSAKSLIWSCEMPVVGHLLQYVVSSLMQNLTVRRRMERNFVVQNV